MYTRNLRIGTLTFADGTTQSMDLQRGVVLRELILHLQGAPTLTGANNTAANLKRGGPWELLKNISVIVNGSEIIRQFSGAELMVRNLFWYGVPPIAEKTFGDASTANPSFDRVLRIPFWMPRTVGLQSTMLDARRLAALQLQVQWGTWTDINATATAWTTTPTLEVYHEYVMPFEGNDIGPFHTWREYDISTAYASTVKQSVINLPVGNLYRGFVVNTAVGSGSSAVDTTGILNEFRFKSGSTVYYDVIENLIRERAYQQMGIDAQTYRSSLTAAFQNISKSTSFNLDAWYWVDLANAGHLSDGVDTLGFAQLTLENDITGQANANLIVSPQMIVPVRDTNGTPQVVPSWYGWFGGPGGGGGIIRNTTPGLVGPPTMIR